MWHVSSRCGNFANCCTLATYWVFVAHLSSRVMSKFHQDFVFADPSLRHRPFGPSRSATIPRTRPDQTKSIRGCVWSGRVRGRLVEFGTNVQIPLDGPEQTSSEPGLRQVHGLDPSRPSRRTLSGLVGSGQCPFSGIRH